MNTGGWAMGSGGNAHCSTIIPINYDSSADINDMNIAWGFKSNHPNGAMFAFADGSIRFIAKTIDHKTYQLLGCRFDGQAVSAQY